MRNLRIGVLLLAITACSDSNTAPTALRANRAPPADTLAPLYKDVAVGAVLPSVTLRVDAAAAPGGDGTGRAPFARIADALDAGRALVATHQVTIVVEPGTYAAEPRPLVFDYQVKLKGPTVLQRDANGVATGGVENAALVQGVSAELPLISVTGTDVVIQGLVLNGGGTAGIGFAVDKSAGFQFDDVHVSNFRGGIIVSASTGRIQGSFVGSPVNFGVTINGGNTAHPADVQFIRNRLLDYRLGGLAAQGAADPFLPDEQFHTLKATFRYNVLSTSLANTGPSNPYGVRFNLVNGPMTTETSGFVMAKMTDNVTNGNHRYPLIINGGQVPRSATVDWSGSLDLDFRDNQWLPGAAGTTESRVFISLTNSRMGIAPFWQELAASWEYVEGATYLIKHDGELDACLGPYSFDCHVDHPEIEPCDGRVLGNVLEISGFKGPFPYGTFVPDVCPSVQTSSLDGHGGHMARNEAPGFTRLPNARAGVVY